MIEIVNLSIPRREEKITYVKNVHEFHNEIPHIEGGIPSLDQDLESPFAAPSPPHEYTHEEFLSTSPNMRFN